MWTSQLSNTHWLLPAWLVFSFKRVLGPGGLTFCDFQHFAFSKSNKFYYFLPPLVGLWVTYVCVTVKAMYHRYHN